MLFSNRYMIIIASLIAFTTQNGKVLLLLLSWLLILKYTHCIGVVTRCCIYGERGRERIYVYRISIVYCRYDIYLFFILFFMHIIGLSWLLLTFVQLYIDKETGTIKLTFLVRFKRDCRCKLAQSQLWYNTLNGNTLILYMVPPQIKYINKPG